MEFLDVVLVGTHEILLLLGHVVILFLEVSVGGLTLRQFGFERLDLLIELLDLLEEFLLFLLVGQLLLGVDLHDLHFLLGLKLFFGLDANGDLLVDDRNLVVEQVLQVLLAEPGLLEGVFFRVVWVQGREVGLRELEVGVIVLWGVIFCFWVGVGRWGEVGEVVVELELVEAGFGLRLFVVGVVLVFVLWLVLRGMGLVELPLAELLLVVAVVLLLEVGLLLGGELV